MKNKEAIRKKSQEALESYLSELKYSDDQFLAAICHTQLENYPKALSLYRKALEGFLGKSRFWEMTNQPNWLANCYLLANQSHLHTKVFAEIEAFNQKYGEALWAQYATALMKLDSNEDDKVDEHVNALTKREKYKEAYAMGETISSLVNRNQEGFNAALENLVSAHRGMAKYGGLRYTPEGFLSMPGMSLSLLAMKRDMKINFRSEYLSKEYIEFLLSDDSNSK